MGVWTNSGLWRAEETTSPVWNFRINWSVSTKRIVSDASVVGLGGLVQKQGLEYWVIIYASISLSDVERKYPQTENKEELGIIWRCERFHINLIGSKFELWTDHRPLEYIFSTKSKPWSARIEQWVLCIQSFDYVMKYISRKRNIADSLSSLLTRPMEKSPEQNGIEMWRSDTEKPVSLKSESDLETTSRLQRKWNIPVLFRIMWWEKWQLCSNFHDSKIVNLIDSYFLRLNEVKTRT